MSEREATVLILAPLHPGVREGLAGHLEVLEARAEDVAALAEDTRTRIRAIACAGSVPPSVMDVLPNLEIIASFGVGYDGIDVPRATQRGIVVTNTPDVLNEEVADAALWLLLDAVRGFSRAQTWLREGRWTRERAYPLSDRTIRTRSVGIYGLGRIGRSIARRVEGLGLSVSYFNRAALADSPYLYQPSLLALARSVDTLIAAVPGGASTDGTVNRDVLTALGRNGIFINVGRGTTVDENALIGCLKDGTIAAAGLDVFANEPDISAELLALDNVTVLPHIAAATSDARAAVARLLVDNLCEWFSHGRALTEVPESAAVTRKKRV